MPLLFALTLFVSATLLFLVQPMVGKMILPLLGGTPAVWNTCMVFFQALLLLGYLYAHKAATRIEPKKQVGVHVAVLLVPLVALALAGVFSGSHSPIPVVKALAPQGQEYPFFGVIALLAVAIGLPFFAVSTSAPLLQKWFAHTGHPASKDPYFLYAASNAGSLLALVAYPALVEPDLRVVSQAWVWAAGYAILVGLTAVCGRVVLSAPQPKKPIYTKPAAKFKQKPSPVVPPGSEPPQGPATQETPPTRVQILRWVGLAFVPSSLMLGVTTYITTDIASLPLLWVIPLGLYLITFIIAFSRVPPAVHLTVTLLAPVLVLLLVFVRSASVRPGHTALIAINLAAFFALALVCHGELARNRPGTKYLTNFFLWVSVGGMLGGLFNALFAPIAFVHASEYPIALVLGCLLLPPLTAPREKADGWAWFWDAVVPVGLFGVTLLLITFREALGEYFELFGRGILGGAIAYWVPGGLAIYNLGRGSTRYAVTLAVLLGASWVGAVLGALAAAFVPSIPNAVGEAVGGALPALGYLVYCYRWVEPERRNRYLGQGLAVLAGCHLLRVFAGPFVADLLGNVQERVPIAEETLQNILAYGVPAMLCYLFVERPLRFGLCVAAVMLAMFVIEQRDERGSVLHRERSFFGILKVEVSSAPVAMWTEIPEEFYDPESPAYVRSRDNKHFFFVPEFIRLVHGTTLHGTQLRGADNYGTASFLAPLSMTNPFQVAAVCAAADEEWKHPGRIPLTYYHRTGPVGLMFDAFRSRPVPSANTDVACIGLGTGSLSAYGEKGQKMTFFEIDPAVVRLVVPPTYFTYIDSAKKQGTEIEMVLGDARLSLERMPERKWGMMLVDAFSSDSIPIHLLTREALELYFARLEEDGLLAVHISNRHLDLEPVVDLLARDLGLAARVCHDGDDRATGKTASTWIVLARTEAALGPKILNFVPPLGAVVSAGAAVHYPQRWERLEHKPEVGLWTDDYSPIMKIMRWRWGNR